MMWLTCSSDTPRPRRTDRYAQAIGSGGQEPTGDLSRDEETAKKLLTAKSPLGVPWIDPEDVSPIVAFLPSAEARMVSGASSAVTAGEVVAIVLPGMERLSVGRHEVAEVCVFGKIRDARGDQDAGLTS